MITDMTFQEIKLYGEIISRLEQLDRGEDVRKEILSDIAVLLRADFASSFVWESKKGEFTRPYTINISDDSTSKYLSWYQHHDPLTYKMRENGCAIASEIMTRKELTESEFYQEVLACDGMYYGINQYFFDNERDIGDIRLWRCKNRSDFGERDKSIFKLLTPFIKKSILRNETIQRISSDLTPRERDVVSLVSKGFTDREISGYLNISFSTVRTHLNNSMQKTCCANRAELAAMFWRNGMKVSLAN